MLEPRHSDGSPNGSQQSVHDGKDGCERQHKLPRMDVATSQVFSWRSPGVNLIRMPC